MLIDVFIHNNQVYTWEFDGKNHFFKKKFKPKIYVLSTYQNLIFLRNKFNGIIEFKKTLKGKKKVLTIETEIKDLRNIINYINNKFNYTCEIFNSDLPLEEYYLFENNLFITKDNNNPYDDYALPKLKSSTIEIRTSYPIRKDFNAELISLKFNKKELTLKQFIKGFEKFNPDIIITEESLVLNYLLEKLRKIQPSFSFSRIGRDQFSQKGNSYFTYGRVIYKSPSSHLKGRLHFRKSGTMYGSWNMHYPFELARICRTTLQKANYKSPGYCISNLQLFYGFKKGILIPRTTSCVEQWKSGLELFNADRGAMILEPEIGYHDNIAEIDFISLFPSIMVKNNISTETLFCKCCKYNKVPGLNINICTKEKGIIPEMLEPLIAQREYYKQSGTDNHKYRANALKGLLVTCFGYMGFKKSKFSRIEAHQSIQAYAREALLKAIKISEEHGFEVIHGITDSLWVKKKGINEEQLHKLIQDINYTCGLKIKLEGIYKWIIFLPSINHSELPVPTRFYGVFEDGEVKCRGIELRRHDTPLIVKETQEKIINELAKCSNEHEFLKKADECKSFVNATIERLNSGKVSKNELLITKRISKTEYKQENASAIVVKTLKKEGYEVNAGDVIRYIILNKQSSIKENRYSPSPKKLIYDRKEYCKLLKKSYFNLFQFRKSSQKTLFGVLNDHKISKPLEV